MAGRVARRLAAILAADVVGYSRLMEVDEEGTHNRLKAHRTEFIEPTVARYQGRIVKLTGDGALVEFSSVVDAVRCASEVQRGMAARNRDLPDNERMVFRIGINLGDVIDDDEDVYGDGVNIAVRLESLATEGGICIADVAYELVRFGNDIEFKDLGLQRLKNIGRSIRVWAWPPEATGQARTTKASVNALPLPNKPSIAILPFANLGDDDSDERFCEGLVDDLITEISRLSGLLVIARNSVSHFKGRNRDPQEISQTLGVHFLLEGSVRRIKQRLRINAQLIDAMKGQQIWAQKFDREFEDIFAIQDEITVAIVEGLEIKLQSSENPLRPRYVVNSNAYDHLLQALAFFHRYTRDAMHRAQRHLVKAVELEPQYAAAHAHLAQSYFNDWSFELGLNPNPFDQGFKLAQRAIELDESSPIAQALIGFQLLSRNEHDRAIERARLAVSLNRNWADGYGFLAQFLNYACEPDEAIAQLQKARRLDPLNSRFVFYLGHSFLLLQQYSDAVEYMEEALVILPDFIPIRLGLVLSNLAAGDENKARNELNVLRERLPQMSLGSMRDRMPYREPEVLERFLDCLRRAGLED